MKGLSLLNIFFAMKRRKRINILCFFFFVHLVRDNFISFITSRVAHDTKRVIERLYTARLKNKAMFSEKCMSSFSIWITSHQSFFSV